LSAKQTLTLIQDAFKTSTHEQASMVATLLADDSNPLTAENVKSKTIAFYFEDRLYRTRSQELLLARLYGDPDPARQDNGGDRMDGTTGAADVCHDPLSLDDLERASDAAEDAWEEACNAAADVDPTEKSPATEDHRVDPKWIELSVTPAGGTVVSIGDKPLDKLAKEVGNGCKIEHRKDDKGLLKISARGPSTISRAKLAFDACIARQELRMARKV
jgi:hypothetical protein